MKNKTITRFWRMLFVIVFFIIIGECVLGQTTIVQWTFEDQNAGADFGIADNLSQTITSATGTPIYSSAGSGGSGTYCASNTGWNAGNGTKYWEINFLSTGYSNLKISSKQRSSDTGPRDFKIQYKVEAGGTWTDLSGATSIVAANDVFVSGVVSNISLPIECDNQASVYLRWIMTSDISVSGGTVGTVGTSRIDDILVTGYSGSVASKLFVSSVNGETEPYINTPFYVVVMSLDTSNNPANVITDKNVTLSVLTGSGLLEGTVTGTISAGENTDTIFGVTYNVAENGVSVKVSDDETALISDTSEVFMVLAIPTPPLIVITEIMYNPPESNTDSLEFIELYNNSSSEIGLKDFTFASGVNFTFPDDTIHPFDYYLLAVDSAKFFHFYGQIAHEWTSGNLVNSGEAIVIRDNFGALVDSVCYLSGAPWPSAANGMGASLTLCDLEMDNSLAENWQASAEYIDSVNNIAVYATPGTGCITTGIENNIKAAYYVNCFPNPVSDNFTLTIEGMPKEIAIYDMLGNLAYLNLKPVYVNTISSGNLNNGIYFIKVTFNNNVVVTKKLLVM